MSLCLAMQALNHAYIALKERDAQDAIPEDAGKIVQLAKQLQQEVTIPNRSTHCSTNFTVWVCCLGTSKYAATRDQIPCRCVK